MKYIKLRNELAVFECLKDMGQCRDKFRSLSVKLNVSAKKIPAGTEFYRAVCWEDLKTDQSWLLYPSISKTPMGRCNQLNNPVFYCSLDYPTVFAEQKERLIEGEAFGVGKWKTTKDCYVIPLGLTQEEERKAGVFPSNIDYSENDKIIHDKIRKYFTELGNKYYPQTIAISEIFMSFVYPNELDVANETVLCFCSVMHPNHDIIPLNFVMPTSFVDKYMQLVSCQYEKIKSVDDSGINKLVLKKSIDLSGSKIVWQDMKEVIVNSKNPYVVMYPSVGGDWIVKDKSGNDIVPDYQESRVEYFK